MDFSEDQVRELVAAFPGVQQAQEGGVTMYLISALQLPDGCTPTSVDALLYPHSRDGYSSRLFFAERFQEPKGRNWNGGIVVAGRTWHAISWQTPAGLRLAEMVLVHVRAFDRRAA